MNVFVYIMLCLVTDLYRDFENSATCSLHYLIDVANLENLYRKKSVVKVLFLVSLGLFACLSDK